jgi:hypothetical protein
VASNENVPVTYIGDVISFAIWVDANNEADAREEAHRRHPHFTIFEIVEVMPAPEDSSDV